jgi:GAF domain-containing protein
MFNPCVVSYSRERRTDAALALRHAAGVTTPAESLHSAGACVFFAVRQLIHLTVGAHADLLVHASIADGEGLSGWVARHGRPLVNGLAIAEFKAAGVQVSDVHLRSALICPLTLREEVIGTIALFHDAADAYTDDHCRMLDQVAVRAASVVQNAVLFEVTKTLSRARRTPPPLLLLDRGESQRGRERVARRR